MPKSTGKREIKVHVVPSKLSTTLGNIGQPGQSRKSAVAGAILLFVAIAVLVVVGYVGFQMGNSGGPEPLSLSPGASSTEEAV